MNDSSLVYMCTVTCNAAEQVSSCDKAVINSRSFTRLALFLSLDDNKTNKQKRL